MIPGVNAVNKKPTLNHRPAIWENILATIYAMNDQGEIKYFDYDYDAAIEFAGIKEKKDVRCFKAKERWSSDVSSLCKGRMAVWVEKLTKEK